MVFKMSGPVRAALGERNADALSAGVGVPVQGQCWVCGGTCELQVAGPGQIALGVIVVAANVTVPVFAHAACGSSRVFSPAEFQEAATTLPAAHEVPAARIVVDGREPVVVLRDGQPPSEAGR